MRDFSEFSDRPIYVISIAAELAKVHPQTLRMYERKKLIRPKRSSGHVRLYSEADIAWVRQIQVLTQELGINLAGVRRIMELQEQIHQAQELIDTLRAESAKLEARHRSEVAEIIIHYSPQIIPHKSPHPVVRRRR